MGKLISESLNEYMKQPTSTPNVKAGELITVVDLYETGAGIEDMLTEVEVLEDSDAGAVKVIAYDEYVTYAQWNGREGYWEIDGGNF